MIHYHGTPCGGTRNEVARFLAGRHALVPWLRDEDIGTVAEVCQSFCLDCSAYTAWKQGQPITDWSGYYRWCDTWLRHPGCDFAVIPDVIDGDEEANNLLIGKWHIKMGRIGLSGVPVWHLHESLKRLAWLCDHYARLALGSSGEYATPGTARWWGRMAEAMGVCCDEQGRPKTKLHLLRGLDPAIFHRLPLASADSTNAVRNGNQVKRFGMYCPPTNGARQAIIADRIEAHNSAAVWVPIDEQACLAFMS